MQPMSEPAHPTSGAFDPVVTESTPVSIRLVIVLITVAFAAGALAIRVNGLDESLKETRSDVREVKADVKQMQSTLDRMALPNDLAVRARSMRESPQ